MKKSRKSKIVLFSVLGLATVSRAPVGFDSWVISGVTPAEEQNITVSAGTVTDNTLTATILGDPTPDLTVAFENTSSGKNFTNGDSGKEEDLGFGFSVKVTKGENSTLGGIKIEFKPSAAFEGLTGSTTTGDTSDDYIVMPYSSDKVVTVNIKEASTNQGLANGGNVTVTSSTTTETIYACSFKFAWGDAFLKVNPTDTKIGTSDSTTELTKSTLITRLKAFKSAFTTASEAGTLMSVVVTPVGA